MTIQSLPLVLRDLITEFAWGAGSYESYLVASVACEVNTWDIPEMFVRRYHMSWKDMCLHVSPLKVFNAAIPPHEWFREDICYMTLQLLDFRRRNVKAHGNRLRWMCRLKNDWTTILSFSSFYLELLTDARNWKQFGFDTAVSLQRVGVFGPPVFT